LNAPRLLSPRIWEALAWSPPLAEHLRLLEAALLTGATVGVTMFVGHLETFPERVEHLMRLRDLSRRAADNGGRLVLVVEQADPATLPATDPRLPDVVAAARPSRADTDTRHAMAVARLALGAGVVRG
jgi:2-iminoacetate synthase ThiH